MAEDARRKNHSASRQIVVIHAYDTCLMLYLTEAGGVRECWVHVVKAVLRQGNDVDRLG